MEWLLGCVSIGGLGVGMTEVAVVELWGLGKHREMGRCFLHVGFVRVHLVLHKIASLGYGRQVELLES
jgi:hypothetical protein